MKVAAYCRVSTDHEDQINSLENQKLYFENYISGNDAWQLVRVYADEGISGTQAKKRPAFMQMIEDAGNKKIELILTKEISRFARNTLDSLQYTRELKALGIGVIFINDNINTLDADAELRLTIMSSIAQEESRKTSERVKWGQKRSMEQGIVFGNGVFGYELNNGILSVNEDEAEIIRCIYHKFVDEGKGSRVIARELYESGYQSKYSAQWSGASILNIIRNEKYAGDLLQKKFFTPNYLDHKKISNKNNDNMIYIKNHHQPIIDRALWEKAQEELKRRSPSRENPIRYSNRYWCSGKIKCGICGAKYIQKTSKRKYGIYKAWVCRSASMFGAEKIDSKGNKTGCDNININYKTLLDCMRFVLDIILENRDKILSELKNEIQDDKQNTSGSAPTDLSRKQKAVELKKEKLIELYVNGILTMDELKAAKAKYDMEIENYKKQICDRENTRDILNKKIDMIFEDIAESDLTDEKISEEIFKIFLEEITIHSGYITVKLKGVLQAMRLSYETKGYKDRYETIITRFEAM